MGVLTPFDFEIEYIFQKLKGKVSHTKKQLFKEWSFSSSLTEATKIDNKGMAKVEQTIAELATDQGIDVSQPIRPSNTEDNQINFPPWVHNNLNHNQFIVASTEDPMLIS